NNLVDQPLSCIEFDEEPFDKGSREAQLTTSYVSTFDRFHAEMNIDSNVDATVLKSNVESKLHLNASTDFTQSTINVVMRAWDNYGNYVLKAGAHLTPAADALKTSDPVKFAADCGSRYV